MPGWRPIHQAVLMRTGNHFQLAMLAYNLNAWLMLFNREPQSDVNALKHTTLATSRLRFLFIAAKIWRHAGRTGISYSDHYEEKTVFQRLMSRLRNVSTCDRPASSRSSSRRFADSHSPLCIEIYAPTAN